jgi:hypothetical protein
MKIIWLSILRRSAGVVNILLPAADSRRRSRKFSCAMQQSGLRRAKNLAGNKAEHRGHFDPNDGGVTAVHALVIRKDRQTVSLQTLEAAQLSG